MDVFYEESSIANKATSGAIKYKILHCISTVFLWLGVMSIILGIMIFGIWFSIMFGMFFLGFWLITWKWKRIYNVSYDYSFVSGELRIARVYNVNKRKLVTRFDCQEIIQFGDVDSPAYERFASAPDTKTVLCTSNVEAAEGKFFMYILIEDNGKKLYILECREALLMNILKFVKRTTLDSDYVMQEKKQKQ